MKKRPAQSLWGRKHGRCRDEVWRYGCGEKSIQNPYGHEKTGHFTALQDTIRTERKTAVSVAPQGAMDNRLHQQSTGKNKFFGFGKDEVPSSNLGSSSKKLLKSVDFGSFCSVLCENNAGQKVGQVR